MCILNYLFSFVNLVLADETNHTQVYFNNPNKPLLLQIA